MSVVRLTSTPVATTSIYSATSATGIEYLPTGSPGETVATNIQDAVENIDGRVVAIETGFTLDELSNVVAPSPTSGQILQFNGTNWVPVTSSAAIDATVIDGSGNAVAGNAVFDELALKAPLAGPTFTGVPSGPTAASNTSTTQLATTAFVTTAVSTAVTGLMDLKGDIDCSTNPNYPAGSKGDAYVVTVAGMVGGALGVAVSIGDFVVCKVDAVAGNHATVGTSWFIIEKNIAEPDATVIDGSTNAVSGNAVFDELALKSPLASPTFTGVPAAPTAAVNTNTTQVATTAFVLANLADATTAATGATGTGGVATTAARSDHRHIAQGISVDAQQGLVVGTDGLHHAPIATPLQVTALTAGKLIDAAKVIDEDTFLTNSDQRIPTQQSTKAYVDLRNEVRLAPAVTQATTSTVFINMTSMTFTPIAGATYDINCWIVYNTSLATNGIGLSYVYLGTGNVYADYSITTSTAGAVSNYSTVNATTGLLATAAPGTTNNLALVKFRLECVTAGGFALQFRSELGSSTITIQTTSVMSVRRIL